MKKLLIKSGQEDKHVAFCLDQFKIQDQDTYYNDLECIINNNIHSDILNTQDIEGVLSNIYQQIEFEKMTRQTKNQQSSNQNLNDKEQEMSDQRRQQLAESLKLQGLQLMMKTPSLYSEMYQYFLNRIKCNFHLVLNFSPTGQNFKDRLVKHQTLLACCTMIWIQDYNQESLEDLGIHFVEFAESQEPLQIGGTASDMYSAQLQQKRSKEYEEQQKQKVLKSCVQMYLDSKEMAKKFFNQTDQILYFTPSIFISMFSNYKRLYDERKQNVINITKRYETGLERIRLTQIAIQEYHLELEKLTPELQEMQRVLIAEINEIEEQFNEVKKQRDLFKREEFQLQQDVDSALQIKIQCEEALNKVVPSLNEAVNSIQSLSKHDLTELRAMKKPPKIIKLVMKAVCIFLQVQPIRKKRKDGQGFKDSYWSASQGKDVLGNVRLPDLLIEYDRNKITQSMMFSIEEVLNDPDYTYENAYRASRAATGMFKWVKALKEYYYIFQEIEPRRDAFMLSEKQYQLKLDELNEKRKVLSTLEQQLKEFQSQLEQREQKVENLKMRVADCRVKKKRADILLRGLSSEKQKWIVCTRMLTGKYLTVTGDVLLSAAFISLLAGFTQKYRIKLINRWKHTLGEFGLPVSDNFNFNDLFGDQMQIRQWQLNGLPLDQPSINNALIMQKSKKYCICIDPQFQATKWIKNQYYESGLIVTKYADPMFKKGIEMAIEMGKLVLVEHADEKIDIQLYSLIKKDISKHGGQRLINFCRKTFKMDKNFDLIITTNLKTPHFDVDVSNLTTIVNFFVTFDGLQQQMLSLTVANERHDLEEKYVENSREAFENIKNLKEIENSILDQLNMDVKKLLSDETLIRTLNESRKTAEFIAMKLKIIAQTQQFMQKQREIFSPVANRATLLYFVVADLSKINSMYQFSLQWFTHIFVKSMQITNQMKQQESRNSKTSYAFTYNKMSPEERIDVLNKTFTQELYKKICNSIYDKDKMLISYLMVLRVLEYENYLDKNLYSFLLGSYHHNDYTEEAPKELKLPWLNTRIWGDLRNLSELKPFNTTNLINHIKENPSTWNDFYNLELFSFDKLPNKDKINIIPLLPEEFQEDNTYPVLKDQDSEGMIDSKSILSKTDDEEIEQNRPLTRNVSSVLNDEDLWHVSSSDDEDDQKDKKKIQNDIYDNDEIEFLNEEEQMARYLVEPQPGVISTNNDSKQNKLKKTKYEYDLKNKKEYVLKCLIELCLLKCIRPDKIGESIDKFLQIIIDTKYTSFSQDILSQYKKVKQSSENIRSDHRLKQSSPNKEDKNKNQSRLSSFFNIMKEAFDDSNKNTPIFFLVAHSVNVFQCLSDFQKSVPEFAQVKLQYLSMGKSLEKTVEDRIIKASQAGDWLLLENLHLVIDWIYKLEEIIIKLEKVEVNQRFRLWLSSVPVENFPPNILQMSIKVSLQPPSGIKQIMDRMVSQHQKHFKKSKQNAKLHKNIFFSLVYFHAILVGRQKYGSLGFNVPYQFDFSDFDISATQVQHLMRNVQNNDKSNLHLIKYMIGQINYAGKIQKNQDMIIIQAIMNDLFCEDIAYAKLRLPENPDKSHYGYPELYNEEETDQGKYLQFIVTLPDQDNEQVFGFNYNIERLYAKNTIFDILKKVDQLNTKTIPFNNPLDIKTKQENDIKVREICMNLLKTLPPEFIEQKIKDEYPFKYEDPFTGLVHREVFKYNRLLRLIRNSLIDLITAIDGKMQSTDEMEQLWYDLFFSLVPQIWLDVSYPTCLRNLGDYIVNLAERVNFVKDWIRKEKEKIDDPIKDTKDKKPNLNCYWFPGFFDQRTFLATLRQKRARVENVEYEQIFNEFEIMKFYDMPKILTREDYTVYISGLWLEGAQWDCDSQLLVESTTQNLFLPFPMIKIKTLNQENLLQTQTFNGDDDEDYDDEDDENFQKKPKDKFYQCPIFKTTMRLGNLTKHPENEPVTNIPLKTSEDPNKWIKRSVALILDIHN